MPDLLNLHLYLCHLKCIDLYKIAFYIHFSYKMEMEALILQQDYLLTE